MYKKKKKSLVFKLSYFHRSITYGYKLRLKMLKDPYLAPRAPGLL